MPNPAPAAAGIPVIVFLDKGILHTPWAAGTWQIKPDDPEQVVASFIGTTSHIRFQPCGRFISIRQHDGDVVQGSTQIGERAERRCSELRGT